MRPGKNTVAVMLFLSSVGLAMIPAGGAGATAAVPAAMESGTLGCAQLEALWEKAGGPPSAAFLAAEVAMAESSGQQHAVNRNTDGSVDRGYWQVNSTWGALSTTDPLGNAKAAVRISRDGTDWSPWVTYQDGLQNGKC